jgi:hypothetical protein
MDAAMDLCQATDDRESSRPGRSLLAPAPHTAHCATHRPDTSKRTSLAPTHAQAQQLRMSVVGGGRRIE